MGLETDPPAEIIAGSFRVLQVFCIGVGMGETLPSTCWIGLVWVGVVQAGGGELLSGELSTFSNLSTCSGGRRVELSLHAIWQGCSAGVLRIEHIVLCRLSCWVYRSCS